MKNDLQKSIDMLIDDIFAPQEMEKSIEIKHDAKTTPENMGEPTAKNDKDRNAGRSKGISGTEPTNFYYDDDITAKQEEDDVEEADQVVIPESMKKADEVVISEEEYEELLSFKKSMIASEELKKAEKDREDQEELIKSAVKKETEELKKALYDQTELIKAFAKTPERPKSITGISQLEKSVNREGSPSNTFTKSDLLNAAEELAKSKTISVDDVIELEMTGYIHNPRTRALIEEKLNEK